MHLTTKVVIFNVNKNKSTIILRTFARVMKAIGKQIKEMRIKRGMTQEELAEKCGLSSKRVIWDYESGRANPSAPKLLKIAEALGCRVVERLIARNN